MAETRMNLTRHSRFRRRFSLLAGLIHVNVNKGRYGAVTWSISAGFPGFRVTWNPAHGHARITIGVPGTGLFWSWQYGNSSEKQRKTLQGKLQ